MAKDLRGLVDVYDEHWQKSVKALGDPSQVRTIAHWIKEMRGFAKEIYETSLKIQNRGGQITSKNNPQDVWSSERVEQMFGKRMSNIDDLERQNEEVARKHGF